MGNKHLFLKKTKSTGIFYEFQWSHQCPSDSLFPGDFENPVICVSGMQIRAEVMAVI